MEIDDRIRDEKFQYHREAAQISAFSSGKINNYEYLTGEEIFPSDYSRIIEEAKLTYSPLGKALKNKEKQLKSKQKKQLKALEVLKPEENKEEIKSVEGLFAKYMRTNEIKNKINDIKKWQSKIK